MSDPFDVRTPTFNVGIGSVSRRFRLLDRQYTLLANDQQLLTFVRLDPVRAVLREGDPIPDLDRHQDNAMETALDKVTEDIRKWTRALVDLAQAAEDAACALGEVA